MVLLELEDVRHHTLDVDFAAVEVRHGTREAESLRERADDLPQHRYISTVFNVIEKRTDLDLVCEYLRWRPMYHRLVLIHAVNHDSAAPPHIIDAVLGELLHARRLHDDIEPIRVVLQSCNRRYQYIAFIVLLCS